MATSTPLQVTILPATEADSLALAQIESIAFSSSSQNNSNNDSDSNASSSLGYIMFGPPSAEGQAFRAKDIAEKIRTDPTLKVWKAVIDSNDNDDEKEEEGKKKIVAWAAWHLYHDPWPGQEWQDKEDWPGARNPQACNDFFGAIARKRSQYMGGKRYACIPHIIHHSVTFFLSNVVFMSSTLTPRHSPAVPKPWYRIAADPDGSAPG